jgi:lipopolysaccharide assembly LptE-like protein
MQRSGVLRVFFSATVFAVTGCLYSLSAGGGLPRGIKTVAVIPFENQTASPDLPNELHTELQNAIHSRLGLRDAPEGRASAVVRGTIVKYEPDIAVGFSADPSRANTARRRVQISIDVQIVDQTTGKTLLDRKGLSAEGEYAERAEEAGRKQAIQRLVNEIIEGAQSQW